MTMTMEGLQKQIDEALRRTEIDALLVVLQDAETPEGVAVLLAAFINFPRVTEAVTLKLAQFRLKSQKSRAKA